MATEYCSVNSKKFNENVFATASYFTRLLLIEYNSSWPENPLLQNNLPADVKDFIQNFKRSSVSNRILFIKNKHKAPHHINVFAVGNLPRTPYTNHFVLTDYAQLPGLSEAQLFSTMPANRSAEVMYLVCTNGKKDKCCSKFGIPIYKQLAQLTSNVWECTHVGGDRFAPNVVVLPYCIFYGALEVNDLAELVRFTGEENLVLNKYRGRSCNSFVEQAAEHYLRQRQNSLGIMDYELIASKEISSKLFEIQFKNTKTGVLTIATIKQGQEPVKRRMTCNAVQEGYPPTYELVNLEITGEPAKHME